MFQIVPFAEIATGSVLVVLAFFLFAPMKRIAAQHAAKHVSTLDVRDEMLVVGWLTLVLTGLSLIGLGLHI